MNSVFAYNTYITLLIIGLFVIALGVMGLIADNLPDRVFDRISRWLGM